MDPGRGLVVVAEAWPDSLPESPLPESPDSLPGPSLVLALVDDAVPAVVLEADIDPALLDDIEDALVDASVSPSVPDSTGSPSTVHAAAVNKDKIKAFDGRFMCSPARQFPEPAIAAQRSDSQQHLHREDTDPHGQAPRRRTASRDADAGARQHGGERAVEPEA